MEYDLPLIQNAIKNLNGTLYNLSEPKTVNECRQKYGLHPIKI